ncbi:hypothetical protein GCM10023259_036970 [Thermocatellispora tengchongensis]
MNTIASAAATEQHASSTPITSIEIRNVRVVRSDGGSGGGVGIGDHIGPPIGVPPGPGAHQPGTVHQPGTGAGPTPGGGQWAGGGH